MMDAGNLHLREMHPQSQQGVCADAIATLEGIDREAVDQLAVTSQQRAKRAMDEGRFDKSLIPVYNRDGTLALDKDEFPRPSTTMESLSGLKTVFNMFMEIPVDDQGNTYGAMVTKKYPQLEGKMNHVHHAGNSSGVVDGAAAILVTSKEYADKNGLKPRARIVATANMGDDPTLMLNAPVPAAKKVLEKAGLTTDDIDVYEINEAFAVQTLACARDLGLSDEQLNPRGGAIALGHPIGASGARILVTLLHFLEDTNTRRGIATLCVGGGMGIALAIERG